MMQEFLITLEENQYVILPVVLLLGAGIGAYLVFSIFGTAWVTRLWQRLSASRSVGRNGDENENDRMVERNRLGRTTFLILTIAVTMLAPGVLLELTLGWLLTHDNQPTLWGIAGSTYLLFIVGMAIGTEVLARIMPRYFITVPQWQAFVTLNPLPAFFGLRVDPNVTYGPGWHISYPWEQRSRSGNVSLEVITYAFEEKVPGRETELLHKGSYQFRAALTMAARFVGLDASTVESGIIDPIKAFLSEQQADKDGDEAKKKIKEINEQLAERFGVKSAHRADEVVLFESEYGVQSIKAIITGIDFPEEVQKTRNARDETRNIALAIANLYMISPEELAGKVKSGEITVSEYHEMIDRAFAASDNATMNIQAFKLNNVSEIARALLNAFGKAA